MSVLRPAAGETDLAAVGALLADHARVTMLLTLGDGRTLPATVLASEAGVAASTASYHLTRLVQAGLLKCQPRGRCRYYGLAGPEVAELIEMLARLAPQRPVTSLRQGTRAHALRFARSCYDHLAGRLGVAVLDALSAQELLSGPDGDEPGIFAVTAKGAERLGGLCVPAGVRQAARGCLDWTEQRPHLAGKLGRQLLARFLELGWVVRQPSSRALTLTELGREALSAELRLTIPA
ncbi:MAG: ArsR/SmtB family transcription factor [Candidatus Dormibacteria bacterium]